MPNNWRRQKIVTRAVKLYVGFVTCRGCGREEECQTERLEYHYPGRKGFRHEDAPDEAEFVAVADQMPPGWSALSSHQARPLDSFDYLDDHLLSEKGMKLHGMGVYFCRDCTPQIKVDHPLFNDPRGEPPRE